MAECQTVCNGVRMVKTGHFITGKTYISFTPAKEELETVKP
jgi:hypothetical protein